MTLCDGITEMVIVIVLASFLFITIQPVKSDSCVYVPPDALMSWTDAISTNVCGVDCIPVLSKSSSDIVFTKLPCDSTKVYDCVTSGEMFPSIVHFFLSNSTLARYSDPLEVWTGIGIGVDRFVSSPCAYAGTNAFPFKALSCAGQRNVMCMCNGNSLPAYFKSASPTHQPTVANTFSPTNSPTLQPTLAVTDAPFTSSPTPESTNVATDAPSVSVTVNNNTTQTSPPPPPTNESNATLSPTTFQTVHDNVTVVDQENGTTTTPTFSPTPMATVNTTLVPDNSTVIHQDNGTVATTTTTTPTASPTITLNETTLAPSNLTDVSNSPTLAPINETTATTTTDSPVASTDTPSVQPTGSPSVNVEVIPTTTNSPTTLPTTSPTVTDNPPIQDDVTGSPTLSSPSSSSPIPFLDEDALEMFFQLMNKPQWTSCYDTRSSDVCDTGCLPTVNGMNTIECESNGTHRYLKQFNVSSVGMKGELAVSSLNEFVNLSVLDVSNTPSYEDGNELQSNDLFVNNTNSNQTCVDIWYCHVPGNICLFPSPLVLCESSQTAVSSFGLLAIPLIFGGIALAVFARRTERGKRVIRRVSTTFMGPSVDAKETTAHEGEHVYTVYENYKTNQFYGKTPADHNERSDPTCVEDIVQMSPYVGDKSKDTTKKDSTSPGAISSILKSISGSYRKDTKKDQNKQTLVIRDGFEVVNDV